MVLSSRLEASSAGSLLLLCVPSYPEGPLLEDRSHISLEGSLSLRKLDFLLRIFFFVNSDSFVLARRCLSRPKIV